MAGDGGAQGLHQDTGGLLGLAQLAGGESHEVIGLQAQGGDHLLLDGRDELGDAAHDVTVLVQAEPVGLAAGDHFHVGEGLVDELAGLVEVADHHGLDPVALKGSETTAGEHVRHILNGEVDAQVRLVGAVLLHSLGVGDAHKGRAGGTVVLAVLGEDGRQHVLQDGEHVLLRGEGHLHIQLIELTGGAVCTGVLIPEAGGDLEIAVEAGGHQQLLELLGRLGQSVELAGVVPGGHQIVPGALGGGGRQDGGGDLQEAVGGHGLAQGGHHVAAQDDVVLHLGVAQVQIAVLEPLGLVGIPAAVDLEGQFVVAAAAQDLDLLGDDLDLAGGHLGGLAGPLPDGARHGDGRLLGDGLKGVYHFGGLRHHLGGAVEVPDHGKRQLGAHFPDVFQPAADLHGLAGVGEAQLPAGMGTILHHNWLFLSISSQYR